MEEDCLFKGRLPGMVVFSDMALTVASVMSVDTEVRNRTYNFGERKFNHMQVQQQFLEIEKKKKCFEPYFQQ